MTDHFLAPEFTRLFPEVDSFARVAALQGEYYRDLPTRKTFRIERGGKGFFVKIHLGCGWKEILKNLFRFKLPVLGAKREVLACQRLAQQHVPSMHVVGFGQRGWNPATQQSFIITEEISNATDIEQFTHTPEYRQLPFKTKLGIINQLATVAKQFHQAGMVHHDFYLCHFLLKQDALETPQCFLIDCHRAQHATQLSPRRRVRDLAALYFSSRDLNISTRDHLRFLRTYFDCGLRQCFTDHKTLLTRINKRASKLYRRVHGRDPRLAVATHSLPFKLQYLDHIFAYQGDYIATSKLNDTFQYRDDHCNVFVKRYYAAGKGLRRYIGRSRLRGEFENLAFFKRLGLATPPIASYAEQKRWGRFKRGVIITEAIADAIDLKTLKCQAAHYFKNKPWRLNLLNKLAGITRTLHQHKFIHQDLKWRNLLVCPDKDDTLYFIDCPLGHKRYFHWLKRGIIKDLMSLDKEAKGFLSKTDRLRFYLRYQQKAKLDAKDKLLIGKIFAAYR